MRAPAGSSRISVGVTSESVDEKHSHTADVYSWVGTHLGIMPQAIACDVQVGDRTAHACTSGRSGGNNRDTPDETSTVTTTVTTPAATTPAGPGGGGHRDRTLGSTSNTTTARTAVVPSAGAGPGRRPVQRAEKPRRRRIVGRSCGTPPERRSQASCGAADAPGVTANLPRYTSAALPMSFFRQFCRWAGVTVEACTTISNAATGRSSPRTPGSTAGSSPRC